MKLKCKVIYSLNYKGSSCMELELQKLLNTIKPENLVNVIQSESFSSSLNDYDDHVWRGTITVIYKEESESGNKYPPKCGKLPKR